MSEKNLNPENECANLFDGKVEKLNDPIVDMFKMQLSLQKRLFELGKGMDYEKASFKEKVDQITIQWRNLTLEFAELLERLPFKEWKSYKSEDLQNFKDNKEKLEIFYEYIDMWHFFMNIGLCLGIDGDTFEKLYITKNQENFARQRRGY